MFELVYTSTPTGLITGRSGFTTVALTKGFPPNLIAPVENLSGYKPFFAPGTEHENSNPVNFTCQPLRLGRTSYLVLSRISYGGLSYTGRSNVIAHHLLFLPDELDDIPGGAVSVLRAEDNFPPWSGEPRLLPLKEKVSHRPLPRGGSMWQRLAGDPRWGQYMADCFHSNPEKGFAFSFDPLQHKGADMLELAAEMAVWMSREDLRHFTFSTYCYSSRMTNPLFLRAYVKDSVQLGSIRRLDPKSVIYLGTGNSLPSSWQAKVSPPEEKEILPERENLSADAASDPSEPRTEHITNRQPTGKAADSAHDQIRPDLPDRTERHAKQESDPTETNQSRQKNKRILILTIICAAVLGLISAVAWRIFTGNRFPENPHDHDEYPENDVNIIKSSANNRKEAGAAAGKKHPGGKVSAAVPPISKTAPLETRQKPKNSGEKNIHERSRKSRSSKTAALSQKKEAAGPKVKFGRLSDRDYFELYRGFYSGKRIKLPMALRDSVKMELILHSIGGVNDIENPKDFISSGGKSVTVYSFQVDTSGIRQSIRPDNDPSGQMILQLSDGFLSFRLPAKKGNNVPQKEDISQIRFISENNDVFTFDAVNLPACIDRMLNKEIKIGIIDEMDNFCFYLHVSDNLWTFRDFYAISINGRSLGKIAKKDILLRKFSQSILSGKTEERKKSLVKLLNSEEKIKIFKTRNRQQLQEPELVIKAPKEIMEKLKSKLEETKRLAPLDDDKAWNLHLDEIKQILQAETRKKELGKGAQKILQDYGDFRKNCRVHRSCQEQLRELQNDHKNSLKEFQKKNADLIKTLKALSPVLFRAVRHILENETPRHLEDIIALYEQIPEQERLEDIKDIKVEVIRRNVNE